MLVKLLNTQHPSRDARELARLRALHDGGRAWRALLDEWVPKNQVEMPDMWADRKARATYANHAGAIVGLFGAYLFAEAPSVEGPAGPFWEQLWNSADGRGTPWAAFWKERFLDAMVGRQSLVWVNLPARGDAQPVSAAEELSSGLLDAYLVGLTPEQVLDWGEDDRGRLTWVMVHGVDVGRTAPDQPRARVHRWTWVDGSEIRRWTWTASADKADPGPDDDAVELPRVAHGFGRLPVVRLELPVGLWAMSRLHDPAVALLRATNDLEWALHRAANALLVIKAKWGDEAPKLGHGYYLSLGQEDSAEYVEPSGASFAILRERIAELREDLYRVVHQMALAADSDAQAAKLSGESKGRDWQAVDIVLSAYGEFVRDAMREAVEVVALVRRENVQVAVKGLDGWQLEDLDVFLTSALQADPLVKSETFRRLTAKRVAERLLGDDVSAEDLALIHKEIDEADYAPVDPSADFRDAGGPAPTG